MANDNTTVDDDINPLLGDLPVAEPAEVYSDDELDRLTDEERTALTEDDAPPEMGADTAQEEQSAAEAEPAPAAAMPDTSEIEQRIAALTAQRDEQRATKFADIQARYDDGAITSDEMAAELAEASRELDALAQEIGTLNGQATAVQSAADAQWEAACQQWTAANPAFTAPEHLENFNAEVFAVTSDARFASMSFDQQLELAARRYAATPMGAALAAATPDTSARPPAATAKAAAPQRQPDPLAPKPAPTLSHVPAETIDPAMSNVAALAARLDREDDPEVREYIMGQIPGHLLDQVLSYGG